MGSDFAEYKVLPSLKEAAMASADSICDIVNKNPQAVIFYATGNTYIPVYKNIAEKIKRGEADFSKTYAFHLDEYYPCKTSDPYSFVSYMRKNVFMPFKIKQNNCFEINGDTKNPDEEVKRYRKLINEYPADLVILGIGPGGHIGFNEAGSSKDSRFRLVKCSKETIYRDRVERGQNTPNKAFTMGVADILKGSQILLTAFGKSKRQLMRKTLSGKVNSSCPASYLRLVGKKVTIFLDKDANPFQQTAESHM
ncbi:glucosamine-6-phosphate deaminase [Candidatus Woesebacteria bacterium]|nr:glucosamine-6-phosphate deaminase [Candidatus Woesebacteria bacterium]